MMWALAARVVSVAVVGRPALGWSADEEDRFDAGRQRRAGREMGGDRGGDRFVGEAVLAFMSVAMTECHECPLIERRGKHLGSAVQRSDGIRELRLSLQGLTAKELADRFKRPRFRNTVQFREGIRREADLQIAFRSGEAADDELRIERRGVWNNGVGCWVRFGILGGHGRLPLD